MIKYNKGENAYCVDIGIQKYCEVCCSDKQQRLTGTREQLIKDTDRVYVYEDFKCLTCKTINIFWYERKRKKNK